MQSRYTNTWRTFEMPGTVLSQMRKLTSVTDNRITNNRITELLRKGGKKMDIIQLRHRQVYQL